MFTYKKNLTLIVKDAVKDLASQSAKQDVILSGTAQAVSVDGSEVLGCFGHRIIRPEVEDFNYRNIALSLLGRVESYTRTMALGAGCASNFVPVTVD